MQISDKYGKIKGVSCTKFDQGKGNCIYDRRPNRANTMGRIRQMFSWNFDISYTVSHAAELLIKNTPCIH